MALPFVTTAAVCIWLILWAMGIRGFDGALVALLLILIAASTKFLGQYLPGHSADADE